jgi:hypothetical protein
VETQQGGSRERLGGGYAEVGRVGSKNSPCAGTAGEGDTVGGGRGSLEGSGCADARLRVCRVDPQYGPPLDIVQLASLHQPVHAWGGGGTGVKG